MYQLLTFYFISNQSQYKITLYYNVMITLKNLFLKPLLYLFIFKVKNYQSLGSVKCGQGEWNKFCRRQKVCGTVVNSKAKYGHIRKLVAAINPCLSGVACALEAKDSKSRTFFAEQIEGQIIPKFFLS